MDLSFIDRIAKAQLSRRGAIKGLFAGAAGAALSDLLLGSAFAAETSVAAGALPAGASASGKAKAVIQVWLAGGPCHIDTFDPKPEAGQDYCGPYNRPIDTLTPGAQICQMLPLLAKQSDKYSIIRSMTHGNNGHETAAYLVQTGRKQSDLVYPGLGAVVAYFKGASGSYQGLLPPYISVTSLQGRFSESGFLGGAYKPFATGGDPAAQLFAVEGVVSESVPEERQKARRALLGQLDSLAKELPGESVVKDLAANQEKAYAIILGDAGKAFDLNQEKSETRDKYGRSRFGQSCLLARRLVERGVPYVTINHGGWDTHKRHFEEMGRKLPELDRGLAALFQELQETGLLDSTIVWVCGEFGRTPKVLWEAPWNGGRGHYGKAFAALVAGGGFKGGTVLGETDKFGESVIKRPVYPWDLAESMRTLLGIDPQAKLPYQGSDVYVSPFTAKEVAEKESGGILKEIM